MTQEEKQLLLKDLCGRLPYGVIVDYKENEFVSPHWKITTIYPETLDGWISYDKKVGAGSESGSRPFNIGEVKPYLRSLSSMTEEEREEVQVFICDEWFFEDSGFATKVRKEGYIEFLANYDCSGIDPEFCGEYADWLTAHHFDYRGLIEKGLALEAPEGMYKE